MGNALGWHFSTFFRALKVRYIACRGAKITSIALSGLLMLWGGAVTQRVALGYRLLPALGLKKKKHLISNEFCHFCKILKFCLKFFLCAFAPLRP